MGTGFGGVPSIPWQVLESPDFGKYDLSSVESVRPEVVADMQDIGVPKSQMSKLTGNFELCFTERANAKDFTAKPASCQKGENALKENEESDPESIQAIRDSLTARGK